jgi:protein-tyrosine phosphatase
MAEGLLRRLFALSGVGATVGSAGLLPGGVPATPDAIATMAARRVDLRSHVSHTVTRELATETPLVICMTRQHVREVCATYGAPMPRTFTLKELVRRGHEARGRMPGEPVSAWLARVNVGRRPADLMGDDPDDDVADPVGRPRAVYEDTANELEDLLRQLVDLLIGTPPRTAAGSPAADDATAYADPARVGSGTVGDDRGDRAPDDRDPQATGHASDPSAGYSRR